MAQVTRQTREIVDHLLDVLLSRWGELPTVAKEYNDWSWAERVDFVEEWPLQEMHLERLERHAASGELTDEQLARYEELRKIVARNRPIIRRLQNS